ncbi:hypothetical protein K0M31_010077 [Melipona bicolor]|uniref:Uncharacterized protein n=1 Tax=Melipona bicolor TaxID=60889 RepID=A0AA40KIS4_9HYME|nr:hypothetical protein K0M31_010077 [Melipona bicolor]
MKRKEAAPRGDDKRERKEASTPRATNPSIIFRTSSRVEDGGGNYQHSRGPDSYASRRVEISRGKGILESGIGSATQAFLRFPARGNTRYLASRRRLTSSRLHQGTR